eukprot:scaffold237211_cov45-Attheya_sp.AAC.1
MADITPTDDIATVRTENQTPIGTADNLISFDGQIMSPPRNDSPFAADIIRHVLSHQTTMNIFDPDNGEYGKITFDILSEIVIFDTQALFTGQRVPLGTKITKTFDGIPFHGSITQYDPINEYYHVNYDDGDSEDFTLAECQ